MSARSVRGIIRKSISHAELSTQNARTARITLDLVPELSHEYAQIVRIVLVRQTPDFLQELLMGDHVAGMLGQRLQQAKLFRRQLNANIVDSGLAVGEIDGERTDANDGISGSRRGLSAQCSATASEKLRHSEWLDHVIVRAKFEQADLLILARSDRE